MVINFWMEKQTKQIDPQLFSKIAEDLAQELNKERIASRDKANKPTQIRKFYDEVLRFQSLIQANRDEFTKLLPYIKMLNAKAAYAMGRDLISVSFKEFISKSIEQVDDPDDFDIFAGFFEAFMGFYKYYVEKHKNESQGGA
jgi:CRISPR-associated protein Csm2